MQIDMLPVRVQIGSSRVVSAPTEGALEALREAEEKMYTVEKSTSQAVNEQALATLLERAVVAGQENLDKILQDARDIGGDYKKAIQSPNNLTVARGEAPESGKGQAL